MFCRAAVSCCGKAPQTVADYRGGECLQVPGEEGTDSEYGFLCERPRRLAAPAPVKGAHKIWALDPLVLARAQKQLYEVPGP